MLLGGRDKSYRTMYEKFIKVAKEHLFFRPMTVTEEDILISGAVNRVAGEPTRLSPELQHLACFTGGMLAIAGKIFKRPEDVEDGAKLTEGCVWAYRSTNTGIMPETFTTVPCKNRTNCPWDTKAWMRAIDPSATEDVIRDRVAYNKLAPGMVQILDGRYLLRYVDFAHLLTALPFVITILPSHKFSLHIADFVM